MKLTKVGQYGEMKPNLQLQRKILAFCLTTLIDDVYMAVRIIEGVYVEAVRDGRAKTSSVIRYISCSTISNMCIRLHIISPLAFEFLR